MTGLSAIDGPAVADAYDFDGIHTIVDVASGGGLLLATLLEKNPHLTGTLYEMPRVLAGAKNGPGCRCVHYEAHHPRLAG
jgi:C-methyltransferase